MSVLINCLVLLGSLFVLVAALGVFRLPDFYTRTHAATKAGAFGGVLMALAAGFMFGQFTIWLQVILITVFFYLTTPVAAHLLARVAYSRKVPFYTKNKSGE